MMGIRFSSTPYKYESILGFIVLYALGTGSIHFYQGIDLSFFSDPFWRFFFFCDLSILV